MIDEIEAVLDDLIDIDEVDDIEEYDEEVIEPKSEEEIQSIVKSACTQAIDFIESEISETRNKSQRYFDGEVDMGYEPGTSQVVATKVRDTCRVILPNLMRIFLSNSKAVEFIPRKPQDVQPAEQATEYINMEYRRLGGFNILYQAIHDAVVKKAGFVKAFWDETEDVEYAQFENLTDDELNMLMQDPSVEITAMESAESDFGPVHSVEAEYTSKSGNLCMEVIPPEDFFINEEATTFEDALVYGHQTDMRVCDLVDMGFDFETVSSLGQVSEDDATEKYERADYTGDDTSTIDDPALKMVTVTECYMKIDLENDGKAVLHRFFCGGTGYEILEMEKWTGCCFAKFEADPKPHLFFGNSYPELLFDDQDAATSMLRGVLNNIAQTNIPRTEVNDEMVNMDDMLNNEIGGMVRVKQMGNINPLAVPFIAGEVLPAMQYYDMQIEAKAGVNNLSAGLNPDLLQNQTATAVNAVTQAGSNQLEAIARHLGEGGMVDLFTILLKLLVENSPEPLMMRTEGKEFVPMDPRGWNVDMDMEVNVGLGTGNDDTKAMAYQMLVPLQKEVLMSGAHTGITQENMRNTVADTLSLAGIHNIDRYWPPTPPAPPQPPAPPPPDPYVQGQQIKAQADLEKAKMDQQSDQQQAMHEMQMKMVEMQGKDDLARDKMAQDLMVDFAQILGNYGTTVDVEAVKQAQAAPRGPDGTPAGREF